MPGWRLREFHANDLDGVLRLWELARASDEEPVYSLAEVVASCQLDSAVVAVAGDELVGVCVARAAHEQGWVVFCSTAPPWRGRGIGSAMLAAVEKRMAPQGLSKMSVLLPAQGDRVEPFLAQGYEHKGTRRYLERQIPVLREELGALAELGGRILPRGLWDAVGGMAAREGADRAPPRPAAGAPRPRRALRHRPATGRGAVRTARYRQDDLRQGDRLPARVGVRRGVPLPARRGARRAWPGRCAARSRPWPSWSTRWCSSTRWRRSPRAGAASRRLRCRASRTSCSRPSRRSASSPTACWWSRRTSSARWTPRSCATAASTT